MENIEKYLLKDEKILWYRSKVVDLVFFIRSVIIFIIVSLIFFPICYLFIFNIQEMITGVIITIVLIITEGILIYLAVYNYKKRKKRLQLTYSQLKNYEEFDIITNKRYIRRYYYLNFKVDLSRYVYENYVEQIGDTVFLKLENIKAIIVVYHIKEINFILEDKASKFYIRDLNMELKDIEKALKILIELLNLERVEQDSQYEKYIRKIS